VYQPDKQVGRTASFCGAVARIYAAFRSERRISFVKKRVLPVEEANPRHNFLR
jgi:hypothetical protein